MSKKILFVCSQNKLRSPTAEAVFCEYEGIETASAGLNESAEIPLSPEHLEWADHVFVMEKTHQSRLNKKFNKELKGVKVTILGIPDDFEYMEPKLVEILKKKCSMYF
jgi:predicted protein tyrosine phosphatase